MPPRKSSCSLQLEGNGRPPPHLSKSTDTRSMATITDSLSGVAGLGSEVRPGLTFSFPETASSELLRGL